MDFSSISIILFGSTFGVILRILLQNNLKINLGFDIQNTTIINFTASFLLGILVALNFVNKDLLLLLYTGFLGSFSTFSSFIYQLFRLIQRRDYIRFFLHYIEILLISLFFFLAGYLTISILKF